MNLDKANLVKGYYNESLTEELREAANLPFRPAAVVMFDCDLYSSTRDALNWVAPYFKVGTILVFDDWFSYGDGPEEGQPRAWAEFLADHEGFRASQIYDYEKHGRVFVLEAAGNDRQRLSLA